MRAGKQSTWTKRIWLIVILLASFVITLQFLIRRLITPPKEKLVNPLGLRETQRVPVRIMGVTKEEAAARQAWLVPVQ